MASIIHELFFDAPIEKVWKAVSTSDLIADWLMPNDFKPEVGHEFTFQTDPVPPHFDGIVHCKVTEVDPPKRLAYSWVGGPLVNSYATYDLSPDGPGTRLRFEHAGFDLENPVQKIAFDAMKGGWSHFDVRLRDIIDNIPDEEK
jgi:uncharacterized protein YndB with AHSA1/START domain